MIRKNYTCLASSHSHAGNRIFCGPVQSIVPSHSGLAHSFAAFGLFCGSLLSVTLELELLGLPFMHTIGFTHQLSARRSLVCNSSLGVTAGAQWGNNSKNGILPVGNFKGQWTLNTVVVTIKIRDAARFPLLCIIIVMFIIIVL